MTYVFDGRPGATMTVLLIASAADAYQMRETAAFLLPDRKSVV